MRSTITYKPARRGLAAAALALLGALALWAEEGPGLSPAVAAELDAAYPRLNVLSAGGLGFVHLPTVGERTAFGGGLELGYGRRLLPWLSAGGWAAFESGYVSEKTMVGERAGLEAVASGGLRLALGRYGEGAALVLDGGLAWAGEPRIEVKVGFSGHSYQFLVGWRNLYGDLYMPLAGVVSFGRVLRF